MRLNFRSIFVVTTAAVALAATLVVAATGGDNPLGDPNNPKPDGVPTPTVSHQDALRHDAEQYAADQGISVDEAVDRLGQQLSAAEVQDKIRSLTADRFAGTWIEHEPEWKVVVWVTGDSSGLDQAFAIADAAAFPVEVRSGAAHTLEELREARAAAVATLNDEALAGSSTNPMTGEVEIEVVDGLEYASDPSGLADRLSGEVGVPVVVTVVPTGSTPIANSYGGRLLYLNQSPYPSTPECTTGFTVWDWLGGVGLATAGHCNYYLAQTGMVYWSGGSEPVLNTTKI